MKDIENFSERQLGFMRMAIELSWQSMDNGGGPFGAVIVRGDEVIASGSNSVTLLNDPTAHAEVMAIRSACAEGGTFDLSGCEMYSSCEPCPMCLGALYWAGIDRVYYANTRRDAAGAGFDDSFIYDEIPLAPEKRSLPVLFTNEKLRYEAIDVFKAWRAKADKCMY